MKVDGKGNKKTMTVKIDDYTRLVVTIVKIIPEGCMSLAKNDWIQIICLCPTQLDIRRND